MRRACLAVVLLGACTYLGGCTYSAYQPALLTIPGGFPDDVFDRALTVLQQNWQPLSVVEREEFRIQSGWLAHEHQGTPGQKRATVFLEDPVTLAVLVEARYLTMPTFGTPQWSTVRGDPALEKQLLEALRQSMGG